MSFLPKLRNTSAPSRVENVAFYGLDKSESASDGYFSDTRNVTSRDFPFISSRDKRTFYKLPEGMKVLGAYSAKELCFILNDGQKSYFYFGGELKGEWEDELQREKFMCEVGGAIYIYPDRKFFHMKDEKAIEEYKATHPKIGEVGEGYFRANFGSQRKNTNSFIGLNMTKDFATGDAVTFWAYDKNTGEKLPLYNMPSGVIMSDNTSFRDVYLYDNAFKLRDVYETKVYSDEDAARIGYEFTYPYEYGEFFLDFANDVKFKQIRKDNDGYQYLIINKDTSGTGPVFSDLESEFLTYSFQKGMTVHFRASEAYRSVIPDNAVIEECGIDQHTTGNTKTTSAYLKFAPDTFKVSSWGNTSYYQMDELSEAMIEYPYITNAIVSNNRVWGYEGNKIYASSLGKPYIMTAYKGLSTDSWAVEVGIKRDFTGVIEYGSIPHYFTEDKIIKVYGNVPSSYQTSETICSGVKSGAGASLSIGNGALFYLDKDGFIAAYTGSYPSVISKKLNEEFESAISCADERFIYFILSKGNGRKKLYTYDLQSGIWLLEGDMDAQFIISHGGGIYIFKDGFIECTEEFDIDFEKYTEVGYESILEFPVNDEKVFNQKKLKKVLLKINAGKGSSLSVEVRETESPEYIKLFDKVISGGDEVLTIPIDCRRTLGYSIRIRGKGKWRLEGIMRRVSIGSYKS